MIPMETKTKSFGYQSNYYDQQKKLVHPKQTLNLGQPLKVSSFADLVADRKDFSMSIVF